MEPLASPASSFSDWLASKGVAGVNPSYILAAITHPSYRSLDPAAESYERLEFLGDAVINLLVADILYRAMPTAPEGILTERRAALVSRDALVVVFDRLGLVRFLRASPGYVPSLKDKGNVVEALFGAVFVWKDFEACHALWLAISEAMPLLPVAGAPQPSPPGVSPARTAYQALYESLGISLIPAHNAKNALQELCQKQGLPLPTYEFVSQTGPDHNTQHQVRLILRPFARDPAAIFKTTGEGSSRKVAALQAAACLCDLISLPYTPQ